MVLEPRTLELSNPGTLEPWNLGTLDVRHSCAECITLTRNADPSRHMSLTAGSRLGSYEIAALIGEGGMGRVYRATDTNLKRTVAIKVLPEAMATDAERLARFQREAEVLARLNHPQIAQIYGLERI